MKKVLSISTMAAMVVATVCADARGLSDYSEVVITTYPHEVEFTSPEEVNARAATGGPFEAVTVYESRDDTGKYYLIVCNGELFQDISTELVGTYVLRLEEEGYTVAVDTVKRSPLRGGDVALRDRLKDFYGEHGYFHLLLVGDLAVPFYEMYDWDYELFPIDLYYMDLDGEWVDADENGYWDEHEPGTGDWYADIPVGRWTAGPLTYGGQTEAELIKHYITKNVAYRSGENPCTERALCYVDDDWSYWGQEWADDVAFAYDDVTAVYNPPETTADDYEDRLDDDYEFIQVCAHSSWVLHQFQENETYDNTYFWEVYNIKPKALFYNLFACSNARYTEDNYMGGWYTFMDNECGLAAVGSTKTGSMLNFGDFYKPLGYGYSIGEAFRWWMELWAEAGGDSRPWHYGMTLIGDPTLCISRFLDVKVLSFNAVQKGDAVALTWEFAGDGGDGFNLYRESRVNMSGGTARAPLNGLKLNDEPIKGESPLTFIDARVVPGTAYVYTLEPVAAGSGALTAEITLETADKASFYLAAPYPNPARDEVRLEYAVPEGAAGTMTVYDISGRRVRTLSAPPAKNALVWDLRDESARAVPPGVYIVNLSAAGDSATKKVVVE